MTGLDVLKVNIHIEGVSFEKEIAEKIEFDAEDDTDDMDEIADWFKTDKLLFTILNNNLSQNSWQKSTKEYII